MYSYTHMCMQMYVEARGHPHAVTSGAVYLFFFLFLRQGLSLSFSSPNSLGCLASNLETACLCFPSTGITKEVLVRSFILWFLGTELRSCNLYYIHFMIELFSQSHLSQKLKTLTKIHFLGGVYYSRIS